MVPTDFGVRLRFKTDATAGLLDVNVQAPEEVDVGFTKLTLATLSKVSEMFVKVPKIGVSAVIVTVIDLVADFHCAVAACVPVIVTVPPSLTVTTSPTTVARLVFADT